MASEQTNKNFDTRSKNDVNFEEESDDDEASRSSTNTKGDKKRKISHSEIERRRREKMNRYIDEIAQLLPIDAVKKLDKLTVLRAAVDTIKQLKDLNAKVSTSGFGKQMFLDDNELLELVLATIDQMGTYFFLLIECQKGRICYASNSTELVFGYKTKELCLQSIFDIVYPEDIEIVKQQLMNEKKTPSNNIEDSSNEAKYITSLSTRQNCLEVGNRRTFSCRIKSKLKLSNKTTTSANPADDYVPVDFVGYIKQYSLNTDNQNETTIRTDRRHSSLNTLTPSDVVNAIGTSPVSCLLTMGNLCKRIEKSNQTYESINTIDRMFLCKLNPDGQFTYFDQICFSLLGYLSQELLGLNFRDFVHDDDRNRITEIWNRVCRDRQIITSGSYRFRTKDNTYITMQTIFEPFINPWNNEVEIIVARNKAKLKSVRIQMSTSNKSDNPRNVDVDSSSTLNSNELIRQLLP